MPMKIAIVGAGPAGCMLARLLQQSKKDVTATIFESEGSINFRSQGGTLDLHEKSGQAALKAANLFDEFQKHGRYDGEAMNMCDKNLLSYVKQRGSSATSSNGRPEIDRAQLRRLLYESVLPGTVVWNHKVHHVDEQRNIHFANGDIQGGFDLIVGADGAWSHVRSRLTEVKPYFTGIGGHAFSILSPDTQHRELYDLVNRGSLFARWEGMSITAQQMGDGTLSCYIWNRRGEDWQKTCGYDTHDGRAAKQAYLQEFAAWDPRLLAFVEAAEDSSWVPRELHMLPTGHQWEHVQGVTLIGDAAHLMPPSAGEGVNLALTDTLYLSRAIIAAASDPSTTLDAQVQIFEKDMFKYAKKVQQLSYDMMRLSMFEPGAPRSTIEKLILAAIRDDLGGFVTSFVAKPLVYIYFGVFKMIW